MALELSLGFGELRPVVGREVGHRHLPDFPERVGHRRQHQLPDFGVVELAFEVG